MLTRLSVQNVVLIEKLTLDVPQGLLALTGETGAGKSILLDALSLALGMRAEAGLVRHGQEQASVTAAFDLSPDHPARAIIKSRDLADGDTLILRRTLGRDGKSKAYINDAPVSIALLREVGAALIEIHGQFETQGLLDAATHRRVLDDFAGLTPDVLALARLWDAWRQADHDLRAAQDGIRAARTQEDYLRHVVGELDRLDPQEGEEEMLSNRRDVLKNREKISGALDRAAQAVSGEDGAQAKIEGAQAALLRVADKMGEALAPILDALARAQGEVADAAAHIEMLGRDVEGGSDLEKIEDRYFALKDCAKKHNCTIGDLPRLHAELAGRLGMIVDQDGVLRALSIKVEKTRAAYVDAAQAVNARRRTQAQKLGRAVMEELPDLKLAQASFIVTVETLDEKDWGPCGLDQVRFLVATNPGLPAGAIDKVASGGELARLMLALKVALAQTSDIPVLVFDEVDSGVGGATADAVGERLLRLGGKCQVLVVTHSPQVAAKADHHWIIAKTAGTTAVTALTSLKERQEEIARMLSGAGVTKEARAAAARLLERHDAAA